MKIDRGKVRRGILVGLLLLLGLWALLSEDTAAPAALSGVVVEGVTAGSALEEAGLLAGDVLTTWHRPAPPSALGDGHRGELQDPFDWMWLVFEQAPRGTVELSGWRGDRPITITVAPGSWESDVGPRIPAGASPSYRRGKRHRERGELEAATEQWLKAGRRSSPLSACWLEYRLGEAWAEGGDEEAAHSRFRAALDGADKPIARWAVRQALGAAYARFGDPEEASESFREARALAQSTWGEGSLLIVENLEALGGMAWRRGDFETAERLAREALEILDSEAPGSLTFARSQGNLATALQSQGDFEAAGAYFESAHGIYRSLAPRSLEMVRSLNKSADLALDRGGLERAEELLVEALALSRELAPGGQETATTLTNLAIVAESRGDLEKARHQLREALEIEREIGNLGGVAVTSNNLAVLAWKSGELDLAIELYSRALEIFREGSQSVRVATLLSNIALVKRDQGDLEGAQSYLQDSVAIVEERAPRSLQMATGLNNLALVAESRGHLDRAMGLALRSLEIRQELAPESLRVANSLNNLARIHQVRRDYDRAEVSYLRALAIQEREAKDSLGLAVTLSNLGALARRRDDYPSAQAYQQRGLEIRRRHAAGSRAVANSLRNLGDLALHRGQDERASRLLGEALELMEEIAPGGLGAAGVLEDLAQLARRGERYGEALGALQRALGIRRRIAPDGADHARTLYLLGGLYRDREPGDPARAAEYFERSLLVLERQLGRLGGSYESRAKFRSQFTAYYREALEIQLALDRPGEAFHTLERFRARSFLEQLAERDTLFTQDIPEELDRDRRRLAVRYDRALEGLEKPGGGDPEGKAEAAQAQLRQLRREADDIEAAIRRASPRLAALRYPQPLALEAARAALDPGTLLLSYSVGRESTLLFSLASDGGLRVDTLPVSEAELRDKVRSLRRRIETSRRPGSQLVRRLEVAAEDLYGLLIEPVGDRLRRAERLLILPDGPLHSLPWGALRGGAGGARYLVEDKPYHLALSVTLFAELRRLRPRRGDGARTRVVAFGDPEYPPSRDAAAGRGDATMRSMAERGIFGWQPLPHSRREVESLAAFYPAGRVRLYLGEEATEERVKSLDRSVGIAHFAVHGHVDEAVPLDSFLALSIPSAPASGRDNGLLQAWEVLEQVRLDADLVVLSACATAAGDELAGEGLVGLTRAFQYAGARTVAASLWQLEDESTAALMTHFHRHLREGRSKDGALRAAQLELLESAGDGEGRLPFHWAAFQLYGDWR